MYMSISYNSCTYSSAFVVVCTYIHACVSVSVFVFVSVPLSVRLCICLSSLSVHFCLCLCGTIFLSFIFRKVRVWRLLLQKCRACGENARLFCENVRVVCGHVECICRNVKRTRLAAKFVGNRHCATAFCLSVPVRCSVWVAVCVAVCCSVLQCVAERCCVRNGILFVSAGKVYLPVFTKKMPLRTPQRTVTHCNTLQHTQQSTHHNALVHTKRMPLRSEVSYKRIATAFSDSKSAGDERG